MSLAICRCDDCLLEITDTWADLILWKDKLSPIQADDGDEDLKDQGAEPTQHPAPLVVPDSLVRSKSLNDIRQPSRRKRKPPIAPDPSTAAGNELRSLPANIILAVEQQNGLSRKVRTPILSPLHCLCCIKTLEKQMILLDLNHLDRGDHEGETSLRFYRIKSISFGMHEESMLRAGHVPNSEKDCKEITLKVESFYISI